VPVDADGGTWLIVDQFEVVFTLCADPSERDRFIDLLLAATDPASRMRVVIAVRADFLGHCAEHPGLTAALQDATVLAGPMTREELREAIVKPAQMTGLIVGRTLTARILDEVDGEPGALPLMSHALLKTWRRRKRRALTLGGCPDPGERHA
jgi:hypothetical protein